MLASFRQQLLSSLKVSVVLTEHGLGNEGAWIRPPALRAVNHLLQQLIRGVHLAPGTAHVRQQQPIGHSINSAPGPRVSRAPNPLPGGGCHGLRPGGLPPFQQDAAIESQKGEVVGVHGKKPLSLLFGGRQFATGAQQLGCKQPELPALRMLLVQGLQVVIGGLQIPLLKLGRDQLQQQLRIIRQTIQLPLEIDNFLLPGRAGGSAGHFGGGVAGRQPTQNKYTSIAAAEQHTSKQQNDGALHGGRGDMVWQD